MADGEREIFCVLSSDFRGLIMANPEHLAILKQGVEVWNEWRKKNSVDEDLEKADLRDTELNGVDFAEVNLWRANLSRANLVRADLSEANLSEANLSKSILDESYCLRTDMSGANLREAQLAGVFLVEANLSQANFRGALLYLANLLDADLNEADFENAEIGKTVFGNVDLRTVRGLETVKHTGPSTVGIDTIYRSQGNIPEVFLRGCGVPDIFIEYARSLVGQPIQFFSCFISHSTKDKRFCERLYADLQAKGVRVWYFPEDVKVGESVWGEIDRSIKVYDKLIVVCSKNSLQSPKVLREIDRALERQDREKKNVLFPIAIDKFIFEEWEHPLKEDVLGKVVGTDFVGWNHSAEKYGKAFRKLLKALKAE